MSFTKINHYEKEYADAHHDTALNVAEGVEDQPIISLSLIHISEPTRP